MPSRRANSRRQSRGFSLLALLAVITILAILAIVVIPHVSNNYTAAREKTAQHRADINLAVERWYFEKGTWPADDLSDIGANQAYFPSGLPSDPTSGAAYTLDSTTHRVN